MKKFKNVLPTILALGILSIVAAPVFASGPLIQVQNPLEIKNLEDLISRLSGIVRTVVIVVMVFVIVYGGYVRMTAQDNADAISKSTKIITGAIIGFFIVVLAPVIVEFVGTLIGVRSSLVDL